MSTKTLREQLIEKWRATDYRKLAAPVRGDGNHRQYWDYNFVTWMPDRRNGTDRRKECAGHSSR